MDGLPTLDLKAMEREMARRLALPLTDPMHPEGFCRDEKSGGWELFWGGYSYWIDDARLASENHLVSWLHHIGAKSWEGCTSQRISAFIEAVMAHIGKRLYA